MIPRPRDPEGSGIYSIAPLAHISFKQVVTPKKPFSPHHANNVNNFILCTIENTNWRNDKLAIRRAFELGGH